MTDCRCRPCDACIEQGLRKQKRLDASELQRVQDAVGYINTTDRLRADNERLRMLIRTYHEGTDDQKVAAFLEFLKVAGPAPALEEKP